MKARIPAWAMLAGLGVGAAPADLLITEVMYDPALGNEHEYIEIFNNGPAAVDLAGLLLTDDPAQDFPNPVLLTQGTVPAGGAAVLVRIDHARLLENYESAWGTEVNFVPVEPWPVFTNAGDVVQLRDPNVAVLASIEYSPSNGFPVPNDAASIYMLDIHAQDLYAASNWGLSQDGVDGGRFGTAPRTSDIGSPGFVPGVAPAAPGDLDGDGDVDLDDLLILLGDFGCVAGCRGDADGDGDADLDDLLIVLGNFGS